MIFDILTFILVSCIFRECLTCLFKTPKVYKQVQKEEEEEEEILHPCFERCLENLIPQKGNNEFEWFMHMPIEIISSIIEMDSVNLVQFYRLKMMNKTLFNVCSSKKIERRKIFMEFFKNDYWYLLVPKLAQDDSIRIIHIESIFFKKRKKYDINISVCDEFMKRYSPFENRHKFKKFNKEFTIYKKIDSILNNLRFYDCGNYWGVYTSNYSVSVEGIKEKMKHRQFLFYKVLNIKLEKKILLFFRMSLSEAETISKMPELYLRENEPCVYAYFPKKKLPPFQRDYLEGDASDLIKTTLSLFTTHIYDKGLSPQETTYLNFVGGYNFFIDVFDGVYE